MSRGTKKARKQEKRLLNERRRLSAEAESRLLDFKTNRVDRVKEIAASACLALAGSPLVARPEILQALRVAAQALVGGSI